MELTFLDIATFIGFMLVVVGVSLYASRTEKTSEDYFLAGRGLGWFLIGISLIASNISTEHFVGMAGSAFGDAGLAIAVYEWHSGIALVIVAWWLLPAFLKAGIYTMPEFLEYRYSEGTRSIMAGYMIAAYMVVLLATVLYSGALALNTIFGFGGMLTGQEIPVINALFGQAGAGLTPENADHLALLIGIWGIGIVASIYTVYGGLTAVVWSDLLQGGALIIGGLLVAFFCLVQLGDGNAIAGWQAFMADPDVEAKMHVFRDIDHKEVPWLGVWTGLWVPVFFYWGLNQFITQRTLAAKSLAEGQKGIFLATFIKLIIPFIIVIPGIMAFKLFGPEIMELGGNAGDKAYPYLITQVLPPWMRGIMLAALVGAVVSTFNSGLNSASTVFTIDIYRKYINPEASDRRQVRIGQFATATIAIIACLWAPVIASFEGVFAYIQEIWGFISPGILAVFVVGLLNKWTPPLAAKTALLLGPVLYAIARVPGWMLIAKTPEVDETKTSGIIYDATNPSLLRMIDQASDIAFLYHMAIIFSLLVIIMLAITATNPLKEERPLPTSGVNVQPWRFQYPVGLLLMGLTGLLYWYFW
jgi:SSS family solute:Na+ symporter